MAVKNRLATLQVREKPSTAVVVRPARSQLIPGLRLEYFDGENFEKKIGERLDSKVASWWGGGDALASLHWAQVGGFVEHPIPPSNFFTSRDAALRAMKKKK